MTKEKSLWERMYCDECYVEIIRAIGYQGCTYRDMLEKLKPLEERFGSQRVQSATHHLVFFEGQLTSHPKPLTQVTLREEVSRLAWQLLGFPPGHPDASPGPWVPPWNRKQAEPPKEEPKLDSLESLFEHQLRDRLREAYSRLSTISPRSKVGKELKKEITAIRKELKRRGMDPNKVEEEVLSKK